MANICYTQYRVEGTTEQIRKLAGKINEDNQRDFYEGSCRYMLYGGSIFWRAFMKLFVRQA